MKFCIAFNDSSPLVTPFALGKALWVALLACAAISIPALAQVEITDPPATHHFGKIPIGSTYATQYFSVFNLGSSAVTLGQVAVDDAGVVVCAAIGCPTLASSDFIVSTGVGCSGLTLQPGAGCSTLVSFIPTAAGERLARLVVPVMGGNTITRQVAGTGTSQPLECVLDWAEQQFKEILTAPSATIHISPFYARCYQGGALCLGADTAAPTFAPPSLYLYQNQSLQSLGFLSTYATQARCQ